jgi:tRNA threonylcarbamoyladenosine biosynthesis protein TsaB
MLLLAVDTSGRDGSLALARVNGDTVEIIEELMLAGGSFSAQLVPQTALLLKKHGYSKSDLVGLAVVSGPGSFTGLRVGLAAIKAVAEVLRIPVAAVSLLEAMAANAEHPGRVVCILDAGRGDFYVGDYDAGPPPQMFAEQLVSKEEFLSRFFLDQSNDKLVVSSDTNSADFARNGGLRVELVDAPRSSDIARLGWGRIQRNETVLPENLEANYIRRTDAEIFSKPKV